MSTRVKQGAIAAAGIAATLVMLWLGLWQMRAFESTETNSAEARAALPAVGLLENIASDGTLTGDVYGRQVRVSGHYLPELRVLVHGADSTRVLAGFQTSDGRLLPVVRGVAPASQEAPAPPEGSMELAGVFLPSEPAADVQPASGLGSVRLAALAQLWPDQQVLPGFLTLDADLAGVEGLTAAVPELPDGDGSWQNLGYALQWWAFAGFAAFMTLRFVRALGQAGTLGSQEEE